MRKILLLPLFLTAGTASAQLVPFGSTGYGSGQLGRDDGTFLHMETLNGDRHLRFEASSGSTNSIFTIAKSGGYEWYANGQSWMNLVNGSLGIGTSAPSNKFMVLSSDGAPAASGTTTVAGIRTTASSAVALDLGVDGGASPVYSWIQSNDRTDLSLKYNLALNPNGGRVGIGTKTPNTRFNVSGYEFANWITSINNTGTAGHSMYFGYNDGGSTTYGLYVTGGAGSPNQIDLGVENKFYVMGNGNVGIGTTSPDEKLAVNGTIHAKEVRIDLTGWSDFVFDTGYRMPSLGELERYLKANHHLPDIPSANEVQDKGIQLGEMNAKLLQKIEELTLYIIEQDKQLQQSKAEIAGLREAVDTLATLKTEIDTLKKAIGK